MSNNNIQPTFTVIIPTYNYANYIGRAIESVLSQDIDCEVIVIDDGSQDNTQEVIAQYAPAVTYIHQKNQGVSAARNHGATLASSEYLIFLDADDCLLPGALQVIEEQVIQNPDIDCLIAGRITIHSNGKKKQSIPCPLSESNLDNFTALLRKKLGSVSIGTVKRTVFNSIQFPESIRNNEDIVLTAQIFACFTCQSIQKPVIEVHKHSDSLRHNLQSITDSTYKVSDQLFDPELLSEDFMRLKNEFSSRVLLSRFRSLYLAGKKTDAKKLYYEAISLYPAHILLLRYLKLHMKCYL